MITAVAPDGVGEVREGDDLADLLLSALSGVSVPSRPATTAPITGPDLRDGDIVAVTSKVVSKAEGSVVTGTRDELLPRETRRLVARRGATAIVRNRLGLTLAAAGIDASNVAAGRVVLHPHDPDASARSLRARLRERTGRNVAVIVTDTAGRAWREGQTDLAIGAAGLLVVESFAGRTDEHGNELVVTAPAVADELAGLAELASGKLGGRPFVIVRGRAELVLPPEEDGPGASSLIRPEGGDLFGYGAREAVLRALVGRDEDRAPFGAPASTDELAEALEQLLGTPPHAEDGSLLVPGRDPRTIALAFAYGWSCAPEGEGTRLTPLTAPGDAG